MKTDEILTQLTDFRRFAMAAGACLTLWTGPAAATEWQPVQSIRDAASTFAAAELGGDGEDIRAEAGELDGRLRMARCDRPLEAFLPNGSAAGNRLIVGVRCTGSKPWKLFVPVRIARFADVLIVRHALPRGHVLTPADLRTERRDLGNQIRAYVSDLAHLPGRRLKRPVIAGTPLTHAMVDAENIVRRGQKVTLLVEEGGMQIRMTGKALADGAKDQRIRVENTSSRRVVEGVVRSPEVVEIMLN